MTETRLQIPPLRTRTLILATLLVATVALLFWLLFRFHNVILILFVAIVISTAISPVVVWLHRRGLPRPLGVALVYTLLFALMISSIALIIPFIGDEVPVMITTLSPAYEEFREAMVRAPNLVVRRLGSELPAQLPFFMEQMSEASAETNGNGEEAATTVSQAWQWLRLLLGTAFAIIATLILAFYWTLDGERTQRSLLLLVPIAQRGRLQETIDDIEEKVGRYIVGQVTLSAVIGLFSLIAYLLIGLPYALPLAIVAGVLEVVPIIGPILGAVPAVIVAFSDDPTKVLWVLLATLIIQQLENNLLVPRLMKRAVGVNPLITLLALIAFGGLFGMLGAVVAIPLAAIVHLLVDRYVIEPSLSDKPVPDGRDRLTVLRYEAQELVQDVRKQIRHKEEAADTTSDQLEDSLELIASDLDSFLAQIQEAEATA